LIAGVLVGFVLAIDVFAFNVFVGVALGTVDFFVVNGVGFVVGIGSTTRFPLGGGGLL
jgi:hypothetical protein